MDAQQLIARYDELECIPGFRMTEVQHDEIWEILRQLEDLHYERRVDHDDKKGWRWQKSKH